MSLGLRVAGLGLGVFGLRDCGGVVGAWGFWGLGASGF